MKDFKCCICKKQITGEWGNNPWGALDDKMKPIEWNPEDKCCNTCNTNRVLAGRIQLYQSRKLV